MPSWETESIGTILFSIFQHHSQRPLLGFLTTGEQEQSESSEDQMSLPSVSLSWLSYARVQARATSLYQGIRALFSKELASSSSPPSMTQSRSATTEQLSQDSIVMGFCGPNSPETATYCLAALLFGRTLVAIPEVDSLPSSSPDALAPPLPPPPPVATLTALAVARVSVLLCDELMAETVLQGLRWLADYLQTRGTSLTAECGAEGISGHGSAPVRSPVDALPLDALRSEALRPALSLQAILILPRSETGTFDCSTPTISIGEPASSFLSPTSPSSSTSSSSFSSSSSSSRLISAAQSSLEVLVQSAKALTAPADVQVRLYRDVINVDNSLIGEEAISTRSSSSTSSTSISSQSTEHANPEPIVSESSSTTPEVAQLLSEQRPPAVVLFTSGSSGLPRAVEVSDKALRWTLARPASLSDPYVPVELLHEPLSHYNGLALLLGTTLKAGRVCVYSHRPSPTRIADFPCPTRDPSSVLSSPPSAAARQSATLSLWTCTSLVEPSALAAVPRVWSDLQALVEETVTALLGIAARTHAQRPSFDREITSLIRLMAPGLALFLHVPADLLLVPSIPVRARLLRDRVLAAARRVLGRRLLSVSFGSAPADGPLRAFLQQLFGRPLINFSKYDGHLALCDREPARLAAVKVWETYGTSETGPLMANGRALPGVRLRIRRMEELEVLHSPHTPPIRRGELLAWSPGRAARLHNPGDVLSVASLSAVSPAISSASNSTSLSTPSGWATDRSDFAQDGWYATGDLVEWEPVLVNDSTPPASSHTTTTTTANAVSTSLAASSLSPSLSSLDASGDPWSLASAAATVGVDATPPLGNAPQMHPFRADEWDVPRDVGRLRVVGRLGERVKLSSGEFFIPRDIEAAIVSSPVLPPLVLRHAVVASIPCTNKPVLLAFVHAQSFLSLLKSARPQVPCAEQATTKAPHDNDTDEERKEEEDREVILTSSEASHFAYKLFVLPVLASLPRHALPAVVVVVSADPWQVPGAVTSLGKLRRQVLLRVFADRMTRAAHNILQQPSLPAPEEVSRDDANEVEVTQIISNCLGGQLNVADVLRARSTASSSPSTSSVGGDRDTDLLVSSALSSLGLDSFSALRLERELALHLHKKRMSGYVPSARELLNSSCTIASLLSHVKHAWTTFSMDEPASTPQSLPTDARSPSPVASAERQTTMRDRIVNSVTSRARVSKGPSDDAAHAASDALDDVRGHPKAVLWSRASRPRTMDQLLSPLSSLEEVLLTTPSDSGRVRRDAQNSASVATSTFTSTFTSTSTSSTTTSSSSPSFSPLPPTSTFSARSSIGLPPPPWVHGPVLLTGASGLVGAHLLASLLIHTRQYGTRIIVLLRDSLNAGAATAVSSASDTNRASGIEHGPCLAPSHDQARIAAKTRLISCLKSFGLIDQDTAEGCHEKDALSASSSSSSSSRRAGQCSLHNRTPTLVNARLVVSEAEVGRRVEVVLGDVALPRFGLPLLSSQPSLGDPTVSLHEYPSASLSSAISPSTSCPGGRGDRTALAWATRSETSSFAGLASVCTAVFHAAAQVDFSASWEALEPANANACLEVISLAALGSLIRGTRLCSSTVKTTTTTTPPLPKSLENIPGWARTCVYLVSTVDTIDAASRTGSPLTPALLNGRVRGRPAPTGYAQSKWLGERSAVRTARLLGVPTLVFCPGHVGPSLATGITAGKDLTSGVLASVAALRLAPPTPFLEAALQTRSPADEAQVRTTDSSFPSREVRNALADAAPHAPPSSARANIVPVDVVATTITSSALAHSYLPLVLPNSPSFAHQASISTPSTRKDAAVVFEPVDVTHEDALSDDAPENTLWDILLPQFAPPSLSSDRTSFADAVLPRLGLESNSLVSPHSRPSGVAGSAASCNRCNDAAKVEGPCVGSSAHAAVRTDENEQKSRGIDASRDGGTSSTCADRDCFQSEVGALCGDFDVLREWSLRGDNLAQWERNGMRMVITHTYPTPLEAAFLAIAEAKGHLFQTNNTASSGATLEGDSSSSRLPLRISPTFHHWIEKVACSMSITTSHNSARTLSTDACSHDTSLSYPRISPYLLPLFDAGQLGNQLVFIARQSQVLMQMLGVAPEPLTSDYWNRVIKALNLVRKGPISY